MSHEHAHVGADPTTYLVRRVLTATLGGALVLTLVGLVWLWPSHTTTRHDLGVGASEARYRATATSVARQPCPEVPEEQCLSVNVRFADGNRPPGTIELNAGGSNPRVATGDALILSPDGRGGYVLTDFQRSPSLVLLITLFVVAVLVLGRVRGLGALAGLLGSVGVLVVFMLPAINEGSDPLLVALVAASVVAFIALYLAHGVTTRTSVALLGTLMSLLITGVLALLFVAGAHITGLADETVLTLQASVGDFDVRGLLLAGIIIGSLGVLDDVTVTQVAAVWELRAASPTMSTGRLYRAAVRIGRDHISSTVNTLVLAYAGASLPLLLLFTQAGRSIWSLATGEVLAVEIIRALVGSIGLIASVPLTTAIAALAVSPSTGALRRDERSRAPRAARGTDEG